MKLVRFAKSDLALAASCPLLLYKLEEEEQQKRILDIAPLYDSSIATRKDIIEAGLSQGFFASLKQARSLVPTALETTGTLASLVKGACAKMPFIVLQNYVQTFGITSLEATKWFNLLHRDPALFAMTHPNGMPNPSFHAIRELHDCSRLLRKRRRWGHTAIPLPSVCIQYEGSHCEDLEVVRKDDACWIALRDYVPSTTELASILARRLNDLSLTIHPRGVKLYIQNEFNALACHRSGRGDDVLVVSCLPNDETIAAFMRCMVVHHSHLPDAWQAPKGAATRVMIVCDAHTLTELELLRLLRWCDANEVNRVRLYGRVDGTPPAERGAGCPFYDIGATLSGGSWVCPPLKPKEPLEEVSDLASSLPDSNWAILVSSARERKAALELTEKQFGSRMEKNVFIGDQLPRLGLWTRIFLLGRVSAQLRHLAEEMVHSKGGKVLQLPSSSSSSYHPQRATLLSGLLKRVM